MIIMIQEYCSSECVVGECKEVYNTWTSCMVKQGQGPSQDILQGGPSPPSDLLVKWALHLQKHNDKNPGMKEVFAYIHVIELVQIQVKKKYVKTNLDKDHFY